MNIQSPLLTEAFKNTQVDSDVKLSKAKKLQLKTACKEFEAVLTSIIMKEGLKSSSQGSFLDEEDGPDNGSQTYMQVANEQMALFVGRQGMLGLGNKLYEQLMNNMRGVENVDAQGK